MASSLFQYSGGIFLQQRNKQQLVPQTDCQNLQLIFCQLHKNLSQKCQWKPRLQKLHNVGIAPLNSTISLTLFQAIESQQQQQQLYKTCIQANGERECPKIDSRKPSRAARGHIKYCHFGLLPSLGLLRSHNGLGQFLNQKEALLSFNQVDLLIDNKCHHSFNKSKSMKIIEMKLAE